MSQSTRTRKSPQQRKKAFVGAALSLFAEFGVEGTTMQQIADRAGVSYGLFYHYFRSKEDILTEAGRQLDLLPRVVAYLQSHETPLEEMMEGLTTFYLAQLEQHRELIWLLCSESRKRPSLLTNLKKLGDETESALAAYLGARREKGEVRPGLDLRVSAKVIWGQLFSYHVWGGPDDPNPWEQIQVILKGIAQERD